MYQNVRFRTNCSFAHLNLSLNMVNAPKVSAAQLRAARVWLEMSQDKVAAKVGLTRTTIVRMEQDPSSVQERTLRDVQKLYQDSGITFLFRKGQGVGICTERPD
jgi:DNA-binding XRE family transcriptional regulator